MVIKDNDFKTQVGDAENGQKTSVINEFDVLVARMRQSMTQLEERVNSRTRDLEVAAEVSRQVSTNLVLYDVLPQFVELTKREFNLYHAHVYLLDAQGENLVLEAGAGEPGRKMVEDGHAININIEHSVVARAARQLQGIIVNDVTRGQGFLANPLLPKTRSEMSIPMVIGNELLGVLDVQADTFNRFTQEDMQTMTTLASQVAVALSNARSFEQTEQLHYQANVVTNIITSLSDARDEASILATIAEYATQSNPALLTMGYIDPDKNGNPGTSTTVALWAGGNSILEHPALNSKFDLHDFPMTQLYIDSPNEVIFIEDCRDDPRINDVLVDILVKNQGVALVVMPLRSAGEWQGVISINWPEPHSFTQEEREIYNALIKPVSSVVATRRALITAQEATTDAEERATEVQTVADVGAQIALNESVDDLLWNVANLTKDNFGRYHVHIYIYDPTTNTLVLRAGAGDVGRQMVEKGHSIPIELETSIVATAARTQEAIVIDDVSSEPNFLKNPLLPETRSEMAVPIILGRELIGVLDIQENRVAAFGEKNVQAKKILANQIAVAFQNTRAFEEQTLQLVISTGLANATDTQTLLDAVANYAISRGLYSANLLYINNNIEGDPEVAETMAVWPPGEDSTTTAVGTKFFLNDFAFANLWLSNPHQPLLITNVQESELVDEETRALYEQLNIKGSALIPLQQSGQWIGLFILNWNEPYSFTQQDERILNSIMQQAISTVSAIRASGEAVHRAELMETVAQISSQITTDQSVEELLWKIANITQQRFNRYHVNMYMYQQDTDTLLLAAASGDIGQQLVQESHAIPLNRKNSIVATVARTQKPNLVNDVGRSPNFLPNALLPNTLAEMAIPIVLGKELIGVLDIQDDETQVFDETALQANLVLVNQLATAIQNARAYENTERALNETEALYDATSTIAHATSYDEILKTILEKSIMGQLDRANIMLFDHAWVDEPALTAEVVAVWEKDGKIRAPIGTTYTVEDFPMVADFKPDEPFIIADADEIKDTDKAMYKVFEALGVRSIAFFPLVAGGQWIGWITGQSIRAANWIKDEEIRKVITLVDQAASLVQSLRLIEQQKAILEERDRLYNTSVDMLGAVGMSDNYFKNLNPAWETTLGWSLEELMSKPYTEFIHPDDLGKMQIEAQEQMDAGRVTLSFENRYITKNGDYRWLSWNAFPDIEHDLTYAVIRDITEQKKTQEYIEHTRERAEKVAQIAGSLSIARDEQDILAAVTESMADESMTMSILAYYETDEAGHVFTSEIVAARSGDGNAIPLAAFPTTKMTAETFPIINLISEKPSEVTYIEDFEEDDTVNANLVAFAKASNVTASLIIPLWTAGRWQGVISMNWAQPKPFSDELRDIGDVVRNSASSVVASRRAFLNAEEARKESSLLASDLEIVASVSAVTTTLLDVDELLQTVSDLTKERFNLYHAHIYLLDSEGENLILAAGAGEPGRMMKSHGHRISMKQAQSIVVRAAKQKVGQISNDVSSNINFLPNPMLPETKSELAVPMLVRGQLIGVLDIQDRKVDRFNDEDLKIQTILAEQIAIAVQNARSFSTLEQQAETERETAERLREVDRLKSQFLANMSHELRTPLNSIIGYSEVLLDGVDGDLSEDALEDVEAVHNSGKHLLSIINEILDLAKIEAGEMQLDLQNVDITEFTKEILRSGQILVKDKNVELRLIEEANVPSIHADPIRLRQILWNLVSNAIKFTEEGTIDIKLGMFNDTTALITVKDSGIGMGDEDLHLIFERFSQVDGSSTRRAGGTGLGLTITKQLIEMHGGQIDVESTQDKGSTFWFTMPIYTAEKV